MQTIFSYANSRAFVRKEEFFAVSGHKSIVSDRLKSEIAKELGVYDTVSTEGWGSVSAKNCGNIVKKAIEIAEKNLSEK
jgi:small acid-soluble spore protein F (minor alpha/beta-type SASP)